MSEIWIPRGKSYPPAATFQFKVHVVTFYLVFVNTWYWTKLKVINWTLICICKILQVERFLLCEEKPKEWVE